MPDILINFSNITIPTPQPFDKNQPDQNRENLCYIIAQILQELKTNNFVLTFPETSTVSGDMETALNNITAAVGDLKFNGYEIVIGDLLKVILTGKTLVLSP